MTGLSGSIEPILAIFALILLGVALRRLPWLDAGFWLTAERLTYVVFLPCLLFLNVAAARFESGQVALVVLAVLAAVLGATIAALGAARLLGLPGRQAGSLLQGAIRPNTYIGVAIGALYGPEGIVTVALCIAVCVPTVNTISVIALSAWSGEGNRGLGAAARMIASNPLILSIVLGLAANLAGVGLPPVIAPAAEVLGRAALPLALLAIGGGLELTTLGATGRPVAAAAAIRLVLAPAVLYAVGTAIGLGGTALTVATLFYALPTAASSYILARQLGGDARLMATTISATTIVSVATILVLATLLGDPAASAAVALESRAASP